MIVHDPALPRVVTVTGIAVACFLSFILGIWTMDKSRRHSDEPNWRNACQLTDVNGNPAFKLAPAERFARQ